MKPTSQSARIIAALESGPATANELADSLDIDLAGAQTRLSELARMGAVEAGGQRPNRGYRRTIWRLRT